MGFWVAYAITSNVEEKYNMSTKQSAKFFFIVYFIGFIVFSILSDYCYLLKIYLTAE